jgi:hypothetical protein
VNGTISIFFRNFAARIITEHNDNEEKIANYGADAREPRCFRSERRQTL